MVANKWVIIIVALVIIAAATAYIIYADQLARAGRDRQQSPTPIGTASVNPTSTPTPLGSSTPTLTPASTGTIGPSASPELTGAQLYELYCSGCHGQLASSTRLGRSAAQIQAAISVVGSMRFLSSLTSSQIQAIASALASPTATSPASATATLTAAPTATLVPTSSVSALPSSTPSPVPSVPSSAQVYSNGQYRVIAWNDLGMHCYNPSFKDLGVLPPYNNLWAQVIRIGEEPRIVTSGVTVSYRIIDNTYSVGKTDFWSYEDQLFGVNLPDNVGLTGNGLSGTMTAAVSAQNGRVDHFEASGIPLTEYRDQDAQMKTRYPFQLAVVSVTDASGALLARTTVTAPVSTEMNCQTCHSDSGVATKKYPIVATGNVDTNILVLHDYLHPQTPSLMNSRPVLCADCHGSNALGLTGKNGVPSLSNSMHSVHANVGISADTSGCYSCHPGPQTQCLRDVMSSQFGLTCVSCHGDMAQVAQNTNPWLNEPRCDSVNCHPSTTTRLNNPLFRHSTAMGGIYCEACHGSTHAIAPTTQANDAIQVMGLQGSNGPLSNCVVCHGSGMGGGNPHIAEDSIPPNALLYLALPFSIATPIFAYVAYKKKLWRNLDFSGLRFWANRKND